MTIYNRFVTRQLSLFSKSILAPRLEHGGELSVGRRKLARPVAVRHPMHVVLRSSLATGAWSLRRRKNRERVARELGRFACRFGIRIYQAANSGNHLHLLVRARRRLDFQNFLRAVAGAIARFVMGRPGRFWDLLAYSRVVQWGRDYSGVRAYVLQNEWEARAVSEPAEQSPRTSGRAVPLGSRRWPCPRAASPQ